MGLNKQKVMDSARKYVDKGHHDRAIKEYLRIVNEDPKDVRVWLKIGDLYARKGAKQEATDTYLKVAKFYGEQGFYLKAVAVYKQILKLDPRLVEVSLKLAELYRQLGLLSDAMQHFEMVASHFHREGKTSEALDTVKQLVELDPDNVATRIKLAELYSKEEMLQDAVAEFSRACDYLRRHNRQEDFLKVAERLLWHKPEELSLSRELATLYLKRNDPRRALQKLQLCFKSDPRGVETLALLAQAFQALNQKSKTVSVLKELARVLQEDGDKAKCAEVHRKILMLAPDDKESGAYLGEGPPPAAPPSLSSRSQPVASLGAPPAAKPAAAVELSLHDSRANPAPRWAGSTGSLPLVEAPEPPPAPSPPMGSPLPGPTERHDLVAELSLDDDVSGDAAEEAHADEIAKILTETEVYVKYGLHQKAVDHLKRIFELEPNNIEANERLKDIYQAQGREDDAIATLVKLAEAVIDSDPVRAGDWVREALGIDGTNSEALALARRLPMDDGADFEVVEDSRFGREDSRAGGEVEILDDDDGFDARIEVSAAAPLPPDDIPDQLAADDVGFEDIASAKHAFNPGTIELSHEQLDEVLPGADDLSGEFFDASFEGAGDFDLDPPDFDPDDARAFDAERDRALSQAADFEVSGSLDEGVPEDADDFDFPDEPFDPAAAREFDADIRRQGSVEESRADSGAEVHVVPSPQQAWEHSQGIELPQAGDVSADFFADTSAAQDYFAGDDKAPQQAAGHDPAGQDDDDLYFDDESYREEIAAHTGFADGDGETDANGIDIAALEPGHATPVDNAFEPPGFAPPAVAAPHEGTQVAPMLIPQADTQIDLSVGGLAQDVDGGAVAQAASAQEGASLEMVAEPYRDGSPDNEMAIEEELDEADFFIAEGLISEARDVLVSLQHRFPDQPEVQQRLQQIADIEGGLDPTKAIELANHEPTIHLEHAVEDSDADTHYDLGLAYKEMGLLGEAIESFTRVKDVPGREVQCRLMIGLCHREQQKNTDAIQHFKEALHIPAITEDEQQTLYYEIGASYEALEDKSEAVYFYEKVLRKDKDYRDISERYERLVASDQDDESASG